jgi:hypothetical protein
MHTVVLDCLEAEPSAVTGYSDAYADLLHNVSGAYQYLDRKGVRNQFASQLVPEEWKSGHCGMETWTL